MKVLCLKVAYAKVMNTNFAQQKIGGKLNVCGME